MVWCGLGTSCVFCVEQRAGDHCSGSMLYIGYVSCSESECVCVYVCTHTYSISHCLLLYLYIYSLTYGPFLPLSYRLPQASSPYQSGSVPYWLVVLYLLDSQ